MARKAASRKKAGAARKSSVTRGKTRGAAKAARKTAASRGGRKRQVARKKTATRKKTASKKKTSTRKRTAPKTRAAGARKAAGRKKTASAPARRSKKAAAAGRSKTAVAPARRRTAPAKKAPRKGGTGRERDLDQTPEAGRSVEGRTNPFPTKRSTGTPAGAGSSRHAPDLDRARRQLREVEESVPGPPSSLDLDRVASAARTGRQELREARRNHPEVSPDITAGDVDADWTGAYNAGDEAPGGDNPTPDQDRVDDIGKALGVEYADNEELKGADKIAARDKKRWELDPASADDYRDRD